MRGHLLFITLTLLFLKPLLGAQTLPPDLVLQDQFGRSHALGAEFHTGRQVLVWSADREAGPLIQAWVDELRKAMPPGTRFWAVADLKAVPFFVPRAAIIGELVKDYPDQALILDWKGQVAALMKPVRSPAYIWIFRDGRLVGSARGEPGAMEARRLSGL